MLLLCLATLGGAFSLELFRQLPDARVFIIFAACGLCLIIAAQLRLLRPAYVANVTGFFLLGFALMGLHATAQLADRLEAGLAGASIQFSARIEGFPQTAGENLRFVVRPIDAPRLPQRLRISWFRAAVVPRLGETWYLHARLRSPRGYSNPGGFDVEGWLFREKIGAIGYVVEQSPSYRIHGAPVPFIDAVRSRIVARIETILQPDPARAVLLAVAAGARHQISADAWDLYARTGTSHLMAISGLHIGLAAGCAYLLTWALLALSGYRQNLRMTALGVAIFAAGAYAAVSGLGIPARRAFLMALVAGWALLFRRRIAFGTLLAVPCAVILLLDPLALLTPGFRLSFGAVVIIRVVATWHIRSMPASNPSRRRSVVQWVRQLSLLQLSLLAGLFPLTTLMFGRFSAIAPAVNLLILPVFNLLTVPLTLAGILLDGPAEVPGNYLLQWAHQSVDLVLQGLARVDAIPQTSHKIRELDKFAILVCFLPLLLIVLPPGWPGRRLAWLAVFAVVSHRPAVPPAGCLDFHVLDVGQGLSVFLRTRERNLLYDTGPAFRTGSNAAEQVVLPYLYSAGVDALDVLMVSHSDQDHAGGVASILAAMPVRRLVVGELLAQSGMPQFRCIAGTGWRDRTSTYAIVHPRHRSPWLGNNASCVLEVSIGAQRILLTGDIEAPVEKLLAYRQALRVSDIVVMPHHGSRTSSTPDLVAATRPGIAIVAASHANRWGFPKADVLARWENAGAGVFNTARSGSVSQRLCRGRPPGPVRQNRIESRKYWHAEP